MAQQTGGLHDNVEEKVASLSPTAARKLHSELSSLIEGDPSMKTDASAELLDLLGKKADDADYSDDAKKGKKAKKADDAEDAEDADDGKKAKKADDADDAEDADDADDARKSKKKAGESDMKKDKKAAKPKGKDKEDEDRDDEDDDDEDDKKSDARKGASLQLITELCAMSGRPDLSSRYILKGYSVAKVRDLLLEKRATADANSGRIMSNYGTPQLSALDQMMTGMRAASAGSVTRPKKIAGIHPDVARGMAIAEATANSLDANPQLYDAYVLEQRDASVIPSHAAMYGNQLRQRLSKPGMETVLSQNTIHPGSTA